MNRPRGFVGAAMCLDGTRVSFEPGYLSEYRLDGRIPEVRKLLRTDLTVPQISEVLGVSPITFRAFVKRRGIANLNERRLFISRAIRARAT